MIKGWSLQILRLGVWRFCPIFLWSLVIFKHEIRYLTPCSFIRKCFFLEFLLRWTFFSNLGRKWWILRKSNFWAQILSKYYQIWTQRSGKWKNQIYAKKIRFGRFWAVFGRFGRNCKRGQSTWDGTSEIKKRPRQVDFYQKSRR